MSLIKFNNRTMNPGIYNFLNDVFSDEFNTQNKPFIRESTPAINVKEADKFFEIEMAVPGMDKDAINVEVEKDVLTISAQKKEEKKEADDKYSRREFNYTSFKRSFTIPEDADGQNIEAKQENGVLYVKILKLEEKMNLKKMIKVA